MAAVEAYPESTERLARNWQRCARWVDDEQKRLTRGQHELVEAAVYLGRRLAPRDMQVGEVIGVWCRFSPEDERLLIVTKLGEDDYTCEVRR